MKATRMVTLLALLAATAGAQVRNSDTLPPQIAALVPQGMKLTSHSFAGASTMAAADFSAEKNRPGGNTLTSITYTFSLHAFDANSPIWKMREPIYRAEMEKKIADRRNSTGPAMSKADSPTETKHGWGSGLSQRVVVHLPNSKETVYYMCSYFGMIGGVTFDLTANGMAEGCGAADQWAASVASAAAKISVSNIGS